MNSKDVGSSGDSQSAHAAAGRSPRGVSRPDRQFTIPLEAKPIKSCPAVRERVRSSLLHKRGRMDLGRRPSRLDGLHVDAIGDRRFTKEPSFSNSVVKEIRAGMMPGRFRSTRNSRARNRRNSQRLRKAADHLRGHVFPR